MSTIDYLKRNGLIKALPYTTFHASEIDKALMTFAKGTHIGKIVISYDHDFQTGIKVLNPYSRSLRNLTMGCLVPKKPLYSHV